MIFISTYLLLLDLNDSSQVLQRGKEPILIPEASYETSGFFPNVVFSNGALPGRTAWLKYITAHATKPYVLQRQMSMSCWKP